MIISIPFTAFLLSSTKLTQFSKTFKILFPTKMDFEVLRVNPAYEICTVFPHPIRKASTQRIVKERIENTGYLRLCLSETVNGRLVKYNYLKHKLIASQFIPNPDDLDVVDHINRNKLDNCIQNLHWVSASENSRNKSSNKGVTYEFRDDIPEEAVVVNDYGVPSFEDYFYIPEENEFYFFNGVQYRRLHVIECRNGSLYVNMLNTEGKSVKVFLAKFRRLYGFD